SSRGASIAWLAAIVRVSSLEAKLARCEGTNLSREIFIMAAVVPLSVTSLGRTWLSTMFLRCKAVSDIARLRNRAAVPNCPSPRLPPRRILYASRAEEATGIPSHTVTACKRLPPYVRRPILGRKHRRSRHRHVSGLPGQKH